MAHLAVRILLACALVFSLPASARRSSFPAGPVTVVVPLAPGDAADIPARALAEEISAELKTPVVTVNRPGAGGAVGTTAVVHLVAHAVGHDRARR